MFTCVRVARACSRARRPQEKETIQIGLKLQEYLIRRGDSPTQIMGIFKAFDQGGNEALDLDEVHGAGP
eukprot:7378445-Prymnesium_polylepis.1